MNKLSKIWKNVSFHNTFLYPISVQKYLYLEKSTKDSNDTSSSSSSSSDSDINLKEKNVNKEETITKLNTLLQQLIQNDTVAKKSNLALARPKDKRVPKEKRESRKIETIEQKLVKAATHVAEDIGGDTKKVESELLSKLLDASSTGSVKNLNEIVKDMQIDRESKNLERSKAEQVRNILKNIKSKSDTVQDKFKVKTRSSVPRTIKPPVVQKIDLFGGEPLGIFTNKNLKENNLGTWQKLLDRDLRLVVTHPPANYFQQMILWTEQGKLWKFPIDNEQGWEEEKNIYFAKHVFLEDHLESWCPSKGPLRHFMELICVGLSKNPYLSVEAKIGHIEWYRNYFEEKRKLLQDTGAIPIDSTVDENMKRLE